MNAEIPHSGASKRAKVVHVAVILLAWCGFRVAAAEQDFSIEPVPAWTTSIEVKENNNPLESQITSGVFTLLVDVEINGGRSERFFHMAEKFLSPGGVETHSRLSFNFDPAYEKLVLHKITLHRGSEVIDELNPAKVRTIQQEKNLDRLIYNGALTAFLFLEDVRVGDWVEYAYTIRGRNPVENGHFYDVLQVRWPFPIQIEKYRLLWPLTNQPLWAQIYGDVPKNRIKTDQFWEFDWHWENRPGQEIEDRLPSESVPYALVHFTDFRTWRDVATWAAKSYHVEKISQELYQKVLALRDEKSTEEQRLIRALQFVQDDVRYLGVENGINSYHPSDPSIVFGRGYGDCKDKVLLFCSIMRFFDADAVPVLVSSSLKGQVQHFIPTPLAFDHAIVQLIFQGKTNYVDLTRSMQRGPLDRRFIDNFGAGLLLDENAPGLIDIPRTDAGMPRTVMTEKFDIPTNAPAELSTMTSYEGRDADFMRQVLATSGRDSLEKSLLDFYKARYPGIVRVTSTETRDDEHINRIQTLERYRIPNIWKPAERTNFITCEFPMSGIMERLSVPVVKERKRPLAIPFPVNFTHWIEIKTHEPWRVLPEEKKIDASGIRFYRRTSCTNNLITIVGELLTLSSGVDATNVPGYLAAVDRIPRFLNFVITKPIPGSSQAASPNWTIWIGVVCYSLILLIAATAVYRHQPKAPPPIPLYDPELEGLGGWLVLLAIGMIIGILMHVAVLVRTGSVYSTENWQVYTDSTSLTYDTLMAPLLLYELFLRVTLLISLIFLVVLFFQRRRLFPALFVGYLAFQFIAVAVDEGLANSRKVKTVTTNTRAGASQAVVPILIPTILWSLYLFRSKRVKMTFLK